MDFMGPVRMKDVEEAQQKIVAVIRKLEDASSRSAFSTSRNTR